MENQKNDFLNGPILSPLLRFAGPVLLALFLQAMYGAVDLIVVGKFAGTADISAVSTGSQAMQLVTSLLVGLTTGVTVLLGQKIGEGRPDEAGSVVGSAICLFVCVALALTALLSALTEPFCRLLQAPEEAFVPTTQYVRICSAGTLFIVAFNVIGSVFRGLGDSKMPLITVAIACVTNIFGDLLLVDVFQMGAAGAALATVFAQAVSVILSLFVIMRRKLPFTFRKEQLRFDQPLTAGILRLGIPIALQDVLVGVSFLVILAIVNSLGLLQSAGMGIAEKVCAFVMLLPSAFSQSVSAFVAQNTGAGKPERAKKALRYSVAVSLCISVFVFYFNFFHGDLLAGIFCKRPCRHSRSGRLSQGLRHRLSADLIPILLCRLFLRPRQDSLCHDAGHSGRVRRPYPRVVRHVPAAERAPVLHRPRDPLLDRCAGPAVPWLLCASGPQGTARIA